MSEKIYFYKTNEEYGYMSNFSRHAITIDNKTYMTTEHYFQSKKAEGSAYEKKLLMHLLLLKRLDWVEVEVLNSVKIGNKSKIM